jgi:tRNA modification GTPase
MLKTISMVALLLLCLISKFSNARHYDALIKTAVALGKADEGLETQVTADFVAMDIRQAMFELGTITGDISTDDLLGNIFSKFCIGK